MKIRLARVLLPLLFAFGTVVEQRAGAYPEVMGRRGGGQPRAAPSRTLSVVTGQVAWSTYQFAWSGIW